MNLFFNWKIVVGYFLEFSLRASLSKQFLITASSQWANFGILKLKMEHTTLSLISASSTSQKPSTTPTCQPSLTLSTITPSKLPSIFPSQVIKYVYLIFNHFMLSLCVIYLLLASQYAYASSQTQTIGPTLKPSTHNPIPTDKPIKLRKPSRNPTSVPTSHPSPKPSSKPTSRPSPHPTSHPTRKPIPNPTGHPTPRPTKQPIPIPTPVPIRKPSYKPTRQPITRRPTQFPTATFQPSITPTANFTSKTPTSFLLPVTPLPTSTLPSFAPFIDFNTAYPSAGTSAHSHNLTKVPTVVPSVAPSTTAFPSTSDSPSTLPTFSPSFVSSLSPSFSALEFIRFPATNILTGVNFTAFKLSITAQSVFKRTVSGCVANVPITSISITAVNELQVKTKEAFAVSHTKGLLRGSEIWRTSRLLSPANQEVAVNYNITIAAASLGTTNLTYAYHLLTHQLSSQVISGNFTKSLRRIAAQEAVNLLLLANSTSVTIYSYQIITGTATDPTLPPSHSSSDSSFDSWPIYGKILLPVAAFIVAIVILIVITFCVRGKKNGGKSSNGSSNSHDEGSMSLSSIYKNTEKNSVEVEKGKHDRWSFVQLGRKKPYDASEEPGEQKGNERIIAEPEDGLVTIVDDSVSLSRSPTPTRTPAFSPQPLQSQTSQHSLNQSTSPSPLKKEKSFSAGSEVSRVSGGKRSSAGRSRSTIVRENSPQRSSILRVDSKRKARGDFTSGDFN